MVKNPDEPKYVTPEQFARNRVGRLLRRKPPPTRDIESTAPATGNPVPPDPRSRVRERQQAYQRDKDQSNEDRLFMVAILSLFVCAPLAFWPLFAGKGKARIMACISIGLWGASIVTLLVFWSRTAP